MKAVHAYGMLSALLGVLEALVESVEAATQARIDLGPDAAEADEAVLHTTFQTLKTLADTTDATVPTLVLSLVESCPFAKRGAAKRLHRINTRLERATLAARAAKVAPPPEAILAHKLLGPGGEVNA